jgi:hypothetical protein
MWRACQHFECHAETLWLGDSLKSKMRYFHSTKNLK